ncbi:helix-turn-helix domain-containing protein [Mycobacterium asiaticum]|uniref:helix-turn-helix domain-containing protein n=1 Tax=Mycobacterium asiaticum TaxID=1790 RepID=UPI0007F03A58|nr:helix-turn-helix domain-containing protein [Mycobacterium asiaticum]OBI98401.1 hypothetical protein A5661_15795 [Mycobacterium asiaticum]
MDRTPAPLPEFVTPTETAACARLSLNVVYRMIADGQLPAVKLRNKWRIRRQDVEALLATGTAQ